MPEAVKLAQAEHEAAKRAELESKVEDINNTAANEAASQTPTSDTQATENNNKTE